MKQISCRDRSEVRNVTFEHYRNLSVEYVDGKKNFSVSEPVAPSLAASYSIEMNVLTRRPTSVLRQRHNVDAVDLLNELNPNNE